MADAPAVDEVAAAKEAAKRAARENRALRKWIRDQLVEPHNFALSVPAIAKCLGNGKLYGLIQVSGNALRAYCHDNGPAESLRFLTGLGLDEDTAIRLRDGPPKKPRKKAGAAPPGGVESHGIETTGQKRNCHDAGPHAGEASTCQRPVHLAGSDDAPTVAPAAEVQTQLECTEASSHAATAAAVDAPADASVANHPGPERHQAGSSADSDGEAAPIMMEVDSRVSE